MKNIYDIPEYIFKTSYQNTTIGHVLTPPSLALEMIETLPNNFFKTGIKILDPACKNGSFLFQIVIKQLDMGWTIKQIEDSIYTCDVLKASLNVAESGIKRIFRFRYQNSLTKIDYILYKNPDIERLYDGLIKTITENKYIRCRHFINDLLLDRKNNWLVMTFEKNLINFIKKYEGLSKTESKLFGEVFTSQTLIEEMLDTLPNDVWTNKDLKCLDPAVGIGNFPAAILQRLMVGLEDVIAYPNERRKWILEEMLYMADISTKNLFILYQLFDANQEFKLNVFRGDFLGEEFDKHMKEVWGLDGFDLCVGNPPFQEANATGDNKLYLYFAKKSINLLKACGILLFITPKNITDYMLMCNKNRNYFDDFYQIDYIALDTPAEYFSGVGSTFLYFNLKKEKYNNPTKIKCYDIHRRNGEITTLLEKGQSMPNFISNIHLSIISKIRNKKDKFNFRKMKINNREFRIRKKQFIDGVVSKIKSNDYLYPVIDGINKSSPFPGKVFFMKNDYSDKKPKLIMNGSGYLCPSYDNTGNYFLSDNMIYIHLDNQDQFENLKYIIKSKIVKYWLCQFRLNGFSDAKNIINFPYIPYNNKITEKNIYKYFNLTDEEIKLIEDTIKN